MRPANKHERHLIERKHQRALEEQPRPQKMPTYEQWLKRHVTTHPGRRAWDNLTEM